MKLRRVRYRNLVDIGLAVAISQVAGIASAQEVEDIIVTAQKRTEDVQDVPISVTSISNDLAAASGIRTSEDLALAVPGLVINRQLSASIIYLRGIGSSAGQAGAENAVATFVDGVYQPSPSSSTFSLNNIERVEVLKGPQGTLYGRNATGGAINIITKDPSHQTAVQAEFGFANLQSVESSMYATTGLTSSLAADVALYYADQGEGFGENVLTGEDTNTRKAYAARVKMLYESEGTRATLAGDYSYDGGSSGASLRPIGSSTLLTGQIGYPYGFWDTQSDVRQRFSIKNMGVSLNVEQEIGKLNFRSLTAYRSVDQFQNGDLDLSEAPLIEFNLPDRTGQFSQELQLTSGSESSAQWVAGLFYLDSYARYIQFRLNGLAFAPADSSVTLSRQDTRSLAAFGQVTFPVAQRTNLTVGARFTNDKRELRATGYLEFPDDATAPLFAPQDRDAKFSKLTWRLALDHKINDDVMVFGSYSRGFKSGIFNLTQPLDPAVRPETLDAFELGFKSELFDKRVRLNSAIFYYKYDDIQLTKIVGASQTLLNAAKASVYGAEVSLEAALADGLTLRAGGEYLHGRYDEFADAPYLNPNPAPPFGNAVVDCSASADACDASGNHMIRTPELTFNASLNYVAKFGDDSLSLNAAYQYNDGFFWDPDNRLKQRPYHLLNAQARMDFDDNKLFVRAWMKNLLNTKYYAFQTEYATGDVGAPAAGRTYGMSIGFAF